MNKLDKIDIKIIKELKNNSKITLTDLSERIKLSKTPTQQRIKKLEKDGYILGYTAVINNSKLGNSHISFVQITLTDTKTIALNTFNSCVLKIPEIEECHMIASGFDYLLKVRTKDMQEYRYILGEKISTLPFVGQTSTYVAMENIKE